MLDAYRFPGCRPLAGIQGIFGDPKARVIRLQRRQKKQYAGVVEQYVEASTIQKFAEYETCRAEMYGYIWKWRFGVFSAGSAGR